MSTTLVSLVAAGTAFLVNIFMSRALGPASRGEVAFVLQAGYVVAPLLSLGLDRQALRSSGRSAPRQSTVWVVAVPIIMIAAATGWLTVAAVVCLAAWTAHLSLIRGVGMAYRDLRRYVLLSFSVQLWILTSSFVLFLTDTTELAWWLGVYLVPAPLMILSMVVARPRSKRPTYGPSRASLIYMLGGASALLAGRVERLLLPALSSSRQLGLYMAVATVSEMVAWAARGLGDSRVQTFVSHDTSRRTIARASLRDLAVFAGASVPVAALASFVVVPMLGPAFEDAQPLVIPLAAASTAWCLYLQLSAMWLGVGSARQSLALELTTTLLTAGMVVLLAPEHGAMGAAIACLSSYATMCVLAIVLVPRRRRASVSEA